MQFDHEVTTEAEQKAGQEVVDAYRRLFTRADGAIVVKDLIRYSGVFEPGYVDGNPSGSAYQEGTKRTVLRILRLSGIEQKFLDLLE